MVRIPIRMNVMIPWHLLQPPPEPAADHDLPHHLDGMPLPPPGSPPDRRFGNYPKCVAARNAMAGFKSQMSPAAVAPVPGLPVTVVAAAGRGVGTSAASVTAGS